jgi:hypothetical protein
VAAWLYVRGDLSAWVCVPLIAFFGSIIHELEHDTIHSLYFKNQPWMRHVIFTLTWLSKPNGPNPWVRNTVPLHPHRFSGTPEDIEEQFIGNGSRYPPLRFLVMADRWFAVSLLPQVRRNSRAFQLWELPAAILPMHVIFTAIWVGWLAAHIAPLRSPDAPLFSAQHMHLLNILMVVLVLPGVLRVFSLQFISSTMHYFGGVKGLLAETQVLDKWYFLPFQFFCCGFGMTHSIHHIVVGQPFYLRHMIRKQCYPAMRKNGVHFNDLSTFAQRNRYPEPMAAAA